VNRIYTFEIYGGLVVGAIGIFILNFTTFENHGDVARVLIFLGLGVGFHGLYARSREGRRKTIDKAVAEFEDDNSKNG
jgi:hypothetical protein